jgi:hypothetical protein
MAVEDFTGRTLAFWHVVATCDATPIMPQESELLDVAGGSAMRRPRLQRERKQRDDYRSGHRDARCNGVGFGGVG